MGQLKLLLAAIQLRVELSASVLIALPADQFLEVFWVTGTLDFDCRGGTFEFPEVFGRELD